MSVPSAARPSMIGDVQLQYEPEKMTLTAVRKSVLMSALFNGLFALWFTYRAIYSAMQGQWAWMAVCIFFVLFDVLLFFYSLKKRDERIVLDRGTNRMQGRTDATIAMVSEIQRIQVAKNQVGFIVFDKEIRPSIALLTARDKAEARWLGQIIAEFLGLPLQVMD